MKKIEFRKVIGGIWFRFTAFYALFVLVLTAVGLIAAKQSVPSLTCHDLLLFALFSVLYAVSFGVGDVLFGLFESRIPGHIVRFLLTLVSFYFVFCRGSLFITAVGSDAPTTNRISKITALLIAFIVVYAVACGISAIVLAVRRKKLAVKKAYEPVYMDRKD